MSRSVCMMPVLDAQPLVFAAGNTLACRLHVIGWELLSVEIDLTSETARIELRSGKRHVMFYARNGRASITSELMTVEQHRVGRKGDITVVYRTRPVFLSRQSGLGLRSGLRALSHYVADNAQLAIPREQVRDIFRPLLKPANQAQVVQANSHGAGVDRD